MLCPKCHRPLEDEGEAYICCAGDVLRWRCTACAKVSEGFAFPHGACPLCGGKLERIESTAAPDAAHEAIRTAFEIELSGHAFYLCASALADDPVLTELFGRLAAMENEHIALLTRRYHVEVDLDAGTAPSLAPDISADDPAALFRQAIAFEERTATFFAKNAERDGADPAERQLYRELAAEEQEHIALLRTEFARWRQGRPGLL